MSAGSTAQSEGSVTDNQAYPIGYMITFRCYGTWLHGDSRGAMDRRNHNCPGDPLMPADARLWASRRAALTQTPMQLDAAQRRLVAETIGAVCCYRNWQLHAAEVRTEHVHVVVSGECRPEAIMTTLKAWCTRRLREAGVLAANGKVWSRHGSTRYLWSEQALEQACRYTLEAQDTDKEA